MKLGFFFFGSFLDMGSLGDHDDDHGETQIFDSQFSPPCSPVGDKGGDADETQCVQNTVTFDETVPNEYAFETQVLNLGCEPQVLDDMDYIENMDDTQLLHDFDDEVAVDSEGGETDGTQVLGDNDELSDDDSVRRISNQAGDGEKMQYTPSGENCGRERSDASTDEQRSSGSVQRGFTSVRAASLRASGLAARSVALKGSDNGVDSVCTSNSVFSELHTVETNGACIIRDTLGVSDEADWERDMEKYVEKVNEIRNAKKCKADCSTVQKRCTGDSLGDGIGLPENNNCAFGYEYLLRMPASDGELAGLSYIDSQEPGDLSQANALAFVDMFLKDNVMEFDKEIDHGKNTGGKSISLSSAKGPQSFARRTNRSTLGETSMFDWDDSREDEGGGDFFCRRKEEFFDSRSCGRKSLPQSLKPNKSKQDEPGEKSKQSNIRDKVVKAKENEKVPQAVQMNCRRNLVTEFDAHCNVDSSSGPPEGNVTITDVSERLDAGFDTQLAAEAMEALFHGEGLATDVNDVYEGTQNNSKGCPKVFPQGKTKNRLCSKKPSSRKRACLSDLGVDTRQFKKSKKPATEFSKESSPVSHKCSKNVKKRHETGLIKGKHKRAEEHAIADGSGDIGKMSYRITKQRDAEGALEINHIDKSHDCDGATTLSGDSLIQNQDSETEIVISSPIAHRTRKSRSVSQLQRVVKVSGKCRAAMKHNMEVSANEQKKSSGSRAEASEILNGKGRSSVTESNQSETDKPSEYEELDHELTATVLDTKIDSLSCPKRRRSIRSLSGQVIESDKFDGVSSPSLQKGDTGQSLARCNRWSRNGESTPVDLLMKKKTQSSALVRPDSSGDPGLNCTTADLNAKVIEKDLDGIKEAISLADIKSNAHPNSKLDESPKEKSKSSSSVCTTPINSTTPVNNVSPICMGNEYFKQSCKRNLSKSCLTKELSRLKATAPERTLALKDLRKRREMADVRVLYSRHLDEDIIKQQKKILVRLGVSVASSMEDATHFITDKFVRTRNMLEAIACGKPVVTHLWLESCGQASCFIDEKNYILRDAKKEKEFGFSMPISLTRACHCPLLQGQKVLITPNTKPGKEIISSLVKAVQGQVVERIGRSAQKDAKFPDDMLVLTCEEDYAICVPFLEKGASVYSSELLLNGIVIQKLEYERHQLFADNVKKTPSTVWLRKEGNKFHPVISHR